MVTRISSESKGEKMDDSKKSFSATKRVSDFGSRGSRRVVRSGRIPCVVYGQSEPVHFTIDAREFANKRRYLTMSTILNIDLDGKLINAFVKEVQEDLLTDKVQHIDFYEVVRGKMLQTKVKIVLEGTPTGVRSGGVLEHVLYEAEVECLPRNLPDSIRVNVENLNVNETLLVKDLPVYEGVKYLDDSEATVATIRYVKEDKPEETSEATSDATATTDAASTEGAKK